MERYPLTAVYLRTRLSGTGGGQNPPSLWVGVEQDPSRAPAHHFQVTVMQCKALYKRDDDHSSFQLLRFAARTGGGSWEESSAG